MRTHTAEDIEKDLDLLWLHEGEGWSQTDLAAREGMSQGHLSRRLARARRHRAALEMQAARENQADDGLDRFDHEYMELADEPTLNHPWCTPEGLTPEERGKYHVGGQVQSLRWGREADEANLTDDLTNATSYQPDPDGLKGGVG